MDADYRTMKIWKFQLSGYDNCAKFHCQLSGGRISKMALLVPNVSKSASASKGLTWGKTYRNRQEVIFPWKYLRVKQAADQALILKMHFRMRMMIMVFNFLSVSNQQLKNA